MNKNYDNACVAAASMSVPLNAKPGSKPNTVIIQYMPPGPQKISPFVNGEPMDMAINVTPEYADVFEAANQVLLAQAQAGSGDEPFTDFNHEDSEASSRPQRYFWGGSDPKTGGVLMETKLTASGKTAIQGGDYSRFSPQWIFSKNTFEPLGLPVNQGGFVNRAAFRTISNLPVVSASSASSEWAAGEPTPADKAASAAQNQSYSATKISKGAFASGTGAVHGAAMIELKKAADAHDHAADLYEKEANTSRAQEHRTIANLHRTEAEKHARRIGVSTSRNLTNAQGTSGINPDFVAEVQARYAEGDISFADATREVELKNPALAKAYVRSFRGGPGAAPATASHPFLQLASSIAQARGCDLEAAKITAAQKDYALYTDYMRSLQASGRNSRQQFATPDKMGELNNAIQELQASGKSYEEAVDIIGYRRPDLAKAYRASMIQ